MFRIKTAPHEEALRSIKEKRGARNNNPKRNTKYTVSITVDRIAHHLVMMDEEKSQIENETLQKSTDFNRRYNVRH